MSDLIFILFVVRYYGVSNNGITMVRAVDVRLPMSLEMLLQNVWLISCSLLLVSLVFWQFLPMLLLLAVLFVLIRNIFR